MIQQLKMFGSKGHGVYHCIFQIQVTGPMK